MVIRNKQKSRLNQNDQEQTGISPQGSSSQIPPIGKGDFNNELNGVQSKRMLNISENSNNGLGG